MTGGLDLDAALGPRLLHRRTRRLLEGYMGRPFPRRATRRICVYYNPSRISFAQIYPLMFYRREIRRRHGVELRYVPVDRLLAGDARRLRAADRFVLQTWFTVEGPALRAALDRLKALNPAAEICFVDSFAHSDLRLARDLDGGIDHYAKKALFRDREEYFKVRRGDTNLVEHYEAMFGLSSEPVDWGTPPSVLDKLRFTPGFFTAPEFIGAFHREELSLSAPRPIDLHARLGTRGSPWYSRMREQAVQAVEAAGLRSVTGPGVPYRRYMSEMAASKLCFSPFGFGELCWRDVEAFLTGAVLLKPDMGHLETRPELYVPGETYVPLAWDFSDLGSKARALAADEEGRARIARAAYDRIADYLRRDAFIDDMDYLLA